MTPCMHDPSYMLIEGLGTVDTRCGSRSSSLQVRWTDPISGCFLDYKAKVVHLFKRRPEMDVALIEICNTGVCCAGLSWAFVELLRHFSLTATCRSDMQCTGGQVLTNHVQDPRP